MIIFQPQPRGSAVSVFKSFSNVLEPDSRSTRGARLTYADAVVFNCDPQTTVNNFCSHNDQPSFKFWSDPMSNGILHERLQNHWRYADVPGIRVDLEPVGEAVFKSSFLNREV